MATRDEFRQAIRAIHAAALDEELWPAALAAICGLLRAVGADLEVVNRRAMRLVEFHSHNLPPATEIAYAEYFMQRNPRLIYGLGQRAGEVAFDYMHMDEAEMRADPFYCEFLPQAEIRYYIATVLVSDSDELAAVSINRSAPVGHVEKDEIALMARLAPHLRHAYDVNRRLRRATAGLHIFEQALDRLADGVVIVRADGRVRYANEAARTIAARADGIRLSGERVSFATPPARKRYDDALEGLRRLRTGGVDAPAADFSVARAEGAPAYLVSVRPILPGEHREWQIIEATALVFIRDPLTVSAGRIAFAAREVFGLTEAEAHFADALCAGLSLQDYATSRRVSLNTVYTHLRRIKAKTGCQRLPQLVARLAALGPPLRDL